MANDNNSLAANLVATRGNRATATLLGTLENEIYGPFGVPDDVQRKIRQIVLDQMNGYKDLVIDIVKSDTAIYNEVWVEKLDEIHTAIKRMV